MFLSAALALIIQFWMIMFVYPVINCIPYYQLDYTNIDLFDQDRTRSCVANALSSAIEYEEKRAGVPILTPSRSFIYHQTRVLEDSEFFDNGVMFETSALSSLAIYGFPQEKDYPFINEYPFGFDVDTISKNIYKKALDNLGKYSYNSITNRSDFNIKRILLSGHAIIVNIRIGGYYTDMGFPSYLSYPPTWNADADSHSIIIVGWDDKNDAYIIQNSWGPTWGSLGFGEIQKSYVQSTYLADDLFTITYKG